MARWSDMKLIWNAKLISALILPLALSACATTDYVSQLSQPNFGVQAPHAFSLEPSAIMYGPFAPKPSQVPCVAADYRCTPQMQLLWADSAPR
ncbi:MAG: hypothetical protein ACLPWG_02900 [Steroidobacteraceae bacterium]